LAHLSSSFSPFLEGFDLDGLESHAGSIYGLLPDLTLGYFNPGWERFAAENGGEPAISHRWPLGASVLTACSALLKAFYISAYKDCLARNLPWEHLYECSTPELERRLHMIVYPLSRKGLLVVNSLVMIRPHDPKARPPFPPIAELYDDQNGMKHQCSHCRRLQRADDPLRWDWIPEWVKHPPESLSHSLCPVCLDYHHPLKP